MKKFFYLLFFLVFLASPSYSFADENTGNPAGNPVDQFTGKYWMDSTADNKKAYLFGIESAIAVEKFIQNSLVAKRAKSGKKPVYTLSPFEKGWMEAFRDVSREQIAEEVTKWYQDNPDKLDRSVLSVIWYELIVPRIKQEKTGK